MPQSSPDDMNENEVEDTSSTASKVYRNDTPVVDLVNYKKRREQSRCGSVTFGF